MIFLQIASIAVVSIVLFIFIMGVRRAMEDNEDRYAVSGALICWALFAVLVVLIIWTVKGLL